MGVTHAVCGDVQLREAGHGDAGLLDGVNEAVSRRHGHGEVQLLWTTRRVRRQQHIGVQHHPLALPQAHCLAQQHYVTWRWSEVKGQSIRRTVGHFLFFKFFRIYFRLQTSSDTKERLKRLHFAECCRSRRRRCTQRRRANARPQLLHLLLQLIIHQPRRSGLSPGSEDLEPEGGLAAACSPNQQRCCSQLQGGVHLNNA